MIRTRLKDYSQKVYKRKKAKAVEEKEGVVCMRENPFYVDTIRAFRDRRYVYKDHSATWKRNLDKALQVGNSSYHI